MTWSMNKQEGFLQDEGKHARMVTYPDLSFGPDVRQADRLYRPRHSLETRSAMHWGECEPYVELVNDVWERHDEQGRWVGIIPPGWLLASIARAEKRMAARLPGDRPVWTQ